MNKPAVKFIEYLSGNLRKDLHGKPFGLWFVIAVLLVWSLLKLTDIYYIVKGEARISVIISLIIIVPVNVVCITGLWKFNKKILNFTRYWFWVSYAVSVFLLPQYVHPDERWGTFFLMAAVMSPVLAGWYILKSSYIRILFKSDD